MDKEKVIETLMKIEREGMDELVKYMKRRGFFRMPASTKYHGNYDGGLLDHSVHVFNVFKDLLIKYKIDGITFESAFLVSILHDLCKAGLYDKNGDTYKWNFFVGKRGHAKLSLERIKKYIKLTELEEQIIKYHMGYYGTHELNSKTGEYSIKELMDAQNNKIVKLFYFADEIASQFLDKQI